MSPQVLVLENEAIIAIDLQTILQKAGYCVMGPVSSAQAAFEVLKEGTPDFALLDLGNPEVFKLADALATCGTTIVFVSGHEKRALPGPHQHHAFVAKPFLPETLLAVIRDARKGQD